MPGEDQYVIATLAQRRDRRRVDRQPVIEVGAEMPVAHTVAQVSVGRRDDAHIHLPRLVRAQALDLAVLQGAQQLGLHRQRQFADLVEQQRAAVGGIEPPRAVGGGAGEGALDVPEQLALGQRLRQRRAIDVHQRLVAPAGMPMQPAREQLLADPGFAQQQHRQLGVGHHLQLAQQLADRLALAENLTLAVLHRGLQHIAARQAQAAVLVFQTGHPHGGLDHQGETLQIAAGRIIEGAGMQGIEGQRAPQLTLDVEADAHAVVHWQGFADMRVEQAVVGVGQATVRLEPGRLALREDRRQPRVLGNDEAPAERLLHQTDRRQRTQAVLVQPQQHHCAAAKMLVQGVHEALQAHGVGQFGGQVGEQGISHHGSSYPQGFPHHNLHG